MILYGESFEKLQRVQGEFCMSDWDPPEDVQRIRTIDAHTAGEPFRVVLEGFPELEGDTILERRRYARQHHDQLRRALMWEPRGHADMYGCLITEPVTPQADLGILFMHNEGFSTMCGHGIIGIATVALETGLLPIQGEQTEIGLDTPAGFVKATAFVENGKVRKVRFINVPSFVLAADQSIELPQYGRIHYDLAFGGAFYAYLEASQLGLSLSPEGYDGIIKAGVALKQAIMAERQVPHPIEPDLSFLYGAIFIGQAQDPAHHSRNVCVFADGEVDRCPTGTGVSGRLAIHHLRGEVEVDQWIGIESIIGSVFRGRIVDTAQVGDFPAVVPEVEGSAYITGRHEFLIQPGDPLKDGFLLR
jgi:trans-L-3-hydroxyproline dehydratase